ncbi:MAG: SRPBCC family protein [Gemmatimonas sp.]
MKIALMILAVVAAFILIVVAIGYSLPVQHRVSREATFAAPADSVFAIITDIEKFPAWRKGLTRVERVSPPGAEPSGALQYREVGGDGDILYSVDESEPPTRLVTRIADKSLPFGGRWTYALTPATNGGTTLRITEDGEVYNPLFRFMSKYVFGHNRTIDNYLRDLRARVDG